jgi:TP901 family phage tail tape measure protein
MAFNINAQVVLSGPKNVRAVSRKIQQQLKNINANVNLTVPQKGSQQLNRLNNTFKTTTASATKLSAASKTTSSSLTRVGSAAKQAGGAMNILGKETALTFKRFAAAGIVTATFFRLTNAITQAIPKALEFQREIVKLQQVTGQTAKGLENISSAARNAAKSLGLDANEVIEIARLFAQAGQNLTQVEASMRAIARSSLAPTFGDMKQTAEGLIAALNQFGISAQQSEAVLGSLNQISKKFAVESQDLIAAIRRAGGVFAISAGQMTEPIDALNQFAAIFTSVRATTRESAETIATGLRTIFTRLQRRDTIQMLENLGIKLTDVQGNFIGLYPAMQRIGQQLDMIVQKGDALTLSAITEELGGIRQMGKLVPALRNFGKAQQALIEGQKGAAMGLGKDVEKGLTPIIKAFEQVQSRFQDFLMTIAESSTFATISKSLIGIANAFLRIGETLAPLLPMLTAFAARSISRAAGGFVTGFMGGFGGGGMGAAAGQAVGGTGNAAQKRTAASAATQTTQLGNILTAANTQNTHLGTQIQNQKTMISLLSSISSKTGLGAVGGRGPARGPRRGFATGGLVPGQGNHDTVPANLTPGEYVIRKSAVEAYGVDRLSKINKYANGGPVQRFKTAGKVDETIPVATANINRDDVTALFMGKGSSGPTSGNVFTATSGKTRVNYAGKRPSAGAKESARFREFAALPGMDKIKSHFSAAGAQAGLGYMDLSYTSAGGMLNEGGLNILDKKMVQSIKQELDNHVSQFMDEFEIPGLSENAQKLADMALDRVDLSAVKGLLFEAFISKTTGALLDPDDRATFDIASIDDDARKAIDKVFGKGSAGSATKGEAKKSLSRESTLKDTGSIVGKLLRTGTPTITTTNMPAGGSGKGRTRKATGGLASGTDTVPALLTPGEFVINRDSAKRYGYSKLSNINKFAKGGRVGFSGGGRVGFNDGGLVGGGAALQLGVSNLTAGITGLTASFAQLESEGLSFASAMNLATTAAMLMAGLSGTLTALKGFNLKGLMGGAMGGFSFPNPGGTPFLAGGANPLASASKGQQFVAGFSQTLKTATGRLGNLGKRLTGLGDKFTLTGGALKNITMPALGAFSAGLVAGAATFYLLDKAASTAIDAFLGIDPSKIEEIGGVKGIKDLAPATAKAAEGLKGIAKQLAVFASALVATMVIQKVAAAFPAVLGGLGGLAGKLGPLAAIVGIVYFAFDSFRKANAAKYAQASFNALNDVSISGKKAAQSLELLAKDNNITNLELQRSTKELTKTFLAADQAAANQAFGKSGFGGGESLDFANMASFMDQVKMGVRQFFEHGVNFGAAMDINQAMRGRGGALGHSGAGADTEFGRAQAARGVNMRAYEQTYGEDEFYDVANQMQVMTERRDEALADVFDNTIKEMQSSLGDDLGAGAFKQAIDNAFKQSLDSLSTEALKTAIATGNLEDALAGGDIAAQSMAKALQAERQARLTMDVSEFVGGSAAETRGVKAAFVALQSQLQGTGRTVSDLSEDEMNKLLIEANATGEAIAYGAGQIASMNRELEREQVERLRTEHAMVALDRASRLARSAMDMLVASLSTLSKQMGEAANRFNHSFEEMRAEIEDTHKSAESARPAFNVFENLSSATNAQIESGVSTAFAGTGVGGEAQYEFVEAMRLNQAMPDIISAAVEQAQTTGQLDSPEQFLQIVKDQMAAAGINADLLPPTVLESIMAGISDKVQGRQQGEGGEQISLEDALKTFLDEGDVDELMKELAGNTEKLREQFSSLIEKQNQYGKAFADTMQLAAEATNHQIQSQKRLIDIQKKYEDGLKNFTIGPETTIESARAKQSERLRDTYGAGTAMSGGGMFAAPASAVTSQEEVDRLRKRRQEMIDEYVAAGGVAQGASAEAQEQGKFQREGGFGPTDQQISDFNANMQANTQALEAQQQMTADLISSTEMLTAAQEVLAREAKKRQSARDIVAERVQRMNEIEQIEDPRARAEAREEFLGPLRAFETMMSGGDLSQQDLGYLTQDFVEEQIKVGLASGQITPQEAEAIRVKYFKTLGGAYGALNPAGMSGDNVPFFGGAMNAMNLDLLNTAATGAMVVNPDGTVSGGTAEEQEAYAAAQQAQADQEAAQAEKDRQTQDKYDKALRKAQKNLNKFSKDIREAGQKFLRLMNEAEERRNEAEDIRSTVADQAVTTRTDAEGNEIVVPAGGMPIDTTALPPSMQGDIDPETGNPVLIDQTMGNLNNMANQATEEGSIFTHDIHLEKLLKKAIGSSGMRVDTMSASRAAMIGTPTHGAEMKDIDAHELVAGLRSALKPLNDASGGLRMSVSMAPMEIILNTGAFSDQMRNIVTSMALNAMAEQLPAIIENRQSEIMTALFGTAQ